MIKALGAIAFLNKLLLVGAVALLGLFFYSQKANAAEDPVEYFRLNCISCHTIGGGRLTGPDLKGVAERQERDWLVKFMQDPKSMIDSGDAYAVELSEKARGALMPTLTTMNADLAKSLLDLIEAESLLEESQFVGLQISDAPFTPAEINSGRDYFVGNKRFQNGAPACISCHTTTDVGGLGGGRLGPELSKVYERLEGRRGLASWLLAPATTTMQPVFKDKALKSEEIMALVAYLESRSKAGGEDQRAGIMVFMFCGLGGAFLLLFMFDMIWKFRFQGVRTPLVNSFKFGRNKE